MRSIQHTCSPVSILVKAPVRGVVKTRLGRAVGDELAARLAGAFLEDTLATVRCVPRIEPVLSTDDPFHPFFRDLCPRPRIVDQGSGDLGRRLFRTLELGLRQADRTIVLAADSPGLPAAILAGAVLALETWDAVLGPSTDGGFYLLGVRHLEPGLLDGLEWSQATTGKATHDRLVARGYRVDLLPPWFDVDEPQDLVFLGEQLRRGRIESPRTAQVLGIETALRQEFTCAATRL